MNPSETQRQALGSSLEELLPNLRTYVRLQCGPLVRSQESCSDLVQSAMREAWQDLAGGKSVEDTGNLKAMLFKAAEHKIIDRARYWQRDKRDVRRKQALPPADMGLLKSYATLSSPSGKLISLEEVERIEGAFDKLPERYRRVILLSRFTGVSYEALGEEMGCNAHSARTLLSRACARLASILGEGRDGD